MIYDIKNDEILLHLTTSELASFNKILILNIISSVYYFPPYLTQGILD